MLTLTTRGERRLAAVCRALIAIATITLLIVGVALIATVLSGCTSPARDALEQHRQQVAAAEERQAHANAERATAAEAWQTLAASIPTLDGLAAALGPEAAAELKAKAIARADALRSQLDDLDALIQRQADSIAGLREQEADLVAAVEAEDGRVAAGFDIADGLIGAAGALVPGLSLLGVVVRSARRRVELARYEGKTEGAKIGAEIVVDSIDELRKQSDLLEDAFGKLTAEQKRAAHLVLETLPDWREVVGLAKAS